MISDCLYVVWFAVTCFPVSGVWYAVAGVFPRFLVSWVLGFRLLASDVRFLVLASCLLASRSRFAVPDTLSLDLRLRLLGSGFLVSVVWLLVPGP